MDTAGSSRSIHRFAVMPSIATTHGCRSRQSKTTFVLSGLELREGCCGQFMPAAETHPPARTLLVVRTGASVAELSDAALPRSIALNQILATRPVRVNPRNTSVAAQFSITRRVGS